jgi:hypothetical protein
MKKILFLFLLSCMMLMPEFSQATGYKQMSKTEVKENFGGGRRNKAGRYRKKKGFLWGLFRGKKQCDCPKH